MIYLLSTHTHAKSRVKRTAGVIIETAIEQQSLLTPASVFRVSCTDRVIVLCIASIARNRSLTYCRCSLTHPLEAFPFRRHSF